jgi:hypothetical protein
MRNPRILVPGAAGKTNPNSCQSKIWRREHGIHTAVDADSAPRLHSQRA